MSLLRRPSATLGALFGVVVMVGILLVLTARETAMGFGPVGDVVAAATRVLVAAAFFWGVAALLFVLARRTRNGGRDLLILSIAAVGAAGVLVVGMILPPPAIRILALASLVLAAWIGGALGAMIRAAWVRRRDPSGGEGGEGSSRVPSLLVPSLNLGAALLVSAGGLGWLLFPASPGGAGTDPGEGGPRPALLAGPSPGEPGVFAVRTFVYGSGTDRRRAEYADSVYFATPTVNLAPLLPDFAPSDARFHRNHWGFGLDAVPLNARVWIPHPVSPAEEGDAAPPEPPFPLVVLVSGIDPDSERSELGFAYLAEHLASRGMVVVGVDVNFLSGPRIAVRAAEMPVRAWLVLEHLRLLSEWQAFDPEGLPALFDLDRIGLVGYSRGGEAVALAAMLNQMGRYPDNASIPLSFGFGIRAVAALAPTDGYHRPSGRPVALTDVSYLAIHGSQDGDLVAFRGKGQYQRISLTEDPPEGRPRPFRASVYVEGANHANFSATRSGSDHPGIVGRLAERRALLPAEAQRRVATVFTAAFLEAALRGDEAMRELFRDPRLAGEGLPRTGFVTRFDDGRTLHLADFEGDLDPGSGSLQGVRLEGRNLVLWREEPLRLRDAARSPQETSVVRLGWDRSAGTGQEPSFEVHLPERGGPGDAHPEPLERALGPGGSLVFSLGSPSPRTEAPDLSVEVETRGGTRSRLRLDFLGPSPEPIQPRLWRLRFLDNLQTRGPEQLLQSFQVPLQLFEAAQPGLETQDIAVIRFVFDRTPSGTILLDDVGLKAPAP